MERQGGIFDSIRHGLPGRVRPELEVFVQGSQFYQASDRRRCFRWRADLPRAAREYYPLLSPSLSLSRGLSSSSRSQHVLVSQRVRGWAGFPRVKKPVSQRGDTTKSTTHIGLRVSKKRSTRKRIAPDLFLRLPLTAIRAGSLFPVTAE